MPGPPFLIVVLRRHFLPSFLTFGPALLSMLDAQIVYMCVHVCGCVCLCVCVCVCVCVWPWELEAILRGPLRPSYGTDLFSDGSL